MASQIIIPGRRYETEKHCILREYKSCCGKQMSLTDVTGIALYNRQDIRPLDVNLIGSVVILAPLKR
jgi:hypothetical protein